MKILVLGKNGQVARELQKFSNISFVGKEDLNFLDLENCKKIIMETDSELIINAVAYTDVEMAENNKKDAMTINCCAPGILAKTANVRKIPLIHISTDYVFGDNGIIPLKENDKANPLGIYGLTKLNGEEEIKKNNSNYIILRTSWIFSKYGKNFLKTMIRMSKTNKKIRVVADQIGSPTEAGDIAKTCMILAEQLYKNKSMKEIYHFTGFPYLSWADYARIIFEMIETNTIVEDISSSEYSFGVVRQKNSRLDCSKIKKQFNIKQPNWKESLKKVIKELKKNE